MKWKKWTPFPFYFIPAYSMFVLYFVLIFAYTGTDIDFYTMCNASGDVYQKKFSRLHKKLQYYSMNCVKNLGQI